MIFARIIRRHAAASTHGRHDLRWRPTSFWRSLHHFLVFALAGIIAAELVLVRPGLKRDTLALVGRIDGAYGGVALAIIVIGAGRVYSGSRAGNSTCSTPLFWAKMGAFVTVGLLSIRPTTRIIALAQVIAKMTPRVADDEILAVRPWIKAEIAVFALIPIFAAAMARGVGY